MKRAKALGGPFAGVILSEIGGRNGNHEHGAEEFARGFGAYRSEFSTEDLVAIYHGIHGDETARKAALALVGRHPTDETVGTKLLMLGEPEQSLAHFEQSGSGVSDGYLNWLWSPMNYGRKARQSPAFQGFAKRHRAGRLLEEKSLARYLSAGAGTRPGRFHLQMKFFAELKRRNVFRAAAFYAASAWLLVQVATQVFPFFHIAEWVVRWIVLAAVVGFPFALLFSWFYEWTPQGFQLESEVSLTSLRLARPAVNLIAGL